MARTAIQFMISIDSPDQRGRQWSSKLVRATISSGSSRNLEILSHVEINQIHLLFKPRETHIAAQCGLYWGGLPKDDLHLRLLESLSIGPSRTASSRLNWLPTCTAVSASTGY